MTAKKFFLFSLLQWVAFVILKVWVFNNVIFGNPGVQEIFFFLLTGATTAALVRRLGVLNYLESFFIIITWTLTGVLVDLVFTSAYTGLSIFGSSQYWWGLFCMDLSVFLFHKKRHVHIRMEHAAHRAALKAHGRGHN